LYPLDVIIKITFAEETISRGSGSRTGSTCH
jgi:hypothetical protein